MFTALILIAIAVVVWGIFSFNRLVRLRNQTHTAWADIDVQLKRQARSHSAARCGRAGIQGLRAERPEKCHGASHTGDDHHESRQTR
jgi:hypothetical protein